MRAYRWWYQLPLRLRSLFSRGQVEVELNEELQYHVEELTEANVAQGMKPEDARAAALRAMEGVEQRKEECRDLRGVGWLENLGRDLRYAFRMLKKSPAFAAVAIVSLALGIGANAAIFTLIDTLLLRPLPVPHPEQLRLIYLDRGKRPQEQLTFPLFTALQAHNESFSHLLAWGGHAFQMRSGTDMVHVDGVLANGDYFAGLGVAAQAGRTFTAADDKPAGGKDGPVAVISDRFWAGHFQRAPAAIGSGLTLDGIRFTVIGVMPQTFFGGAPDMRPDIWAPLSLAARVSDPESISSRSYWWLVIMGRLKDGVTAEGADAQLRTAGPLVMRDALPPWGHAQQKRFLSWRLNTWSGEKGWSFLRLIFGNPLAILMTLVGLVLLIACANMANLLLARATARHREIGVRLAMGAGRARIIRQLLTESALLSLLGGIAGTFFALWLTRFLGAYMERAARSDERGIQLDLHPDWRVVLFTLGMAVGTGMLFGLAPALRATRVGIGASLKESAASVRGQRRLSFGRVTLALQAAFSVLLVAAAGLFAASLYELLTQRIGFNPNHVVTIGLDTSKRPETGVALMHLYRTLLERVNAVPGMRTASVMMITPLGHGGWDENLTIAGRPDLSEEERDTYINAVAPAFFKTMEIPLLAGRPIGGQDTAGSEKVGIINELAARRFFPDANPVGIQVPFHGAMLRIIGVAGDIKYLDMRQPTPPEFYIPYTQIPAGPPTPSLTFAIRTDLSLSVVSSEFRTVLRQVAPDVPMGMVKTMDEQLADSLGQERIMASLSIFFGVLALLLTAIGLYGILAYAVTRRSGEIGIRMALGAQRSSVVWLVASETTAYVCAGVAVGVAAVLGLSRFAADLLYGVKPNDAGNLILSVGALVVVAALAGVVPSMRAARLDPMRALREE